MAASGAVAWQPVVKSGCIRRAMHPRACALSSNLTVFSVGGCRGVPVSGFADWPWLLASNLTARAQQAAAAPPVSFNRDIRPILANNCFACHGPDEKQRETKFHFDTQEGAFLKAGVIERGNAAESLLIEKITDPDPKERMPPPDSGHALTPRQIELLAPMDRRRREVGHALGLYRPGAARSARGQPRPVGAQPDRSVHPRAPRTRRAEAVARSRQDDAAAPRDLRPDRPAADAGRGRRVPRRPLARRVREARRCAAAVPALRRADGRAVARRRPLRRHARLPHRQPPRHVALARLGHRRLQPQPALRPVHDRAARGRSAPERHARRRRSPRASIATT